jgi:DNA-binding NarL/FixJ family response regulator
MQNVLILEDSKETRERLCEILHEAFSDDINITEAKTLQEGRRYFHHLPFELALIDIHLPDGLGYDFLKEIKHIRPEYYCIIVTIFDDEEHIFNALKAGADGYLIKEQPKANLVRKLRGTLNGEPPLSPGVARRILRHFQAADERTISPSSQQGETPILLTKRETEILIYIAKGYSNPEIAKSLGLKRATVATYVKGIYRKLGISSRAEAALEASRRGFVQ